MILLIKSLIKCLTHDDIYEREREVVSQAMSHFDDLNMWELDGYCIRHMNLPITFNYERVRMGEGNIPLTYKEYKILSNVFSKIKKKVRLDELNEIMKTIDGTYQYVSIRDRYAEDFIEFANKHNIKDRYMAGDIYWVFEDQNLATMAKVKWG